MQNLHKLLDLAKTQSTCTVPGCLEESTDWGQLCQQHEVQSQEEMKDDDDRFCMETSMNGAEGHESCLLCGKTWTQHHCSRCKVGYRIEGWTFCQTCHETAD